MNTFETSFPPALLLLSDSALPLGSFAFSSGLESYLAHHATTTNTGSVVVPINGEKTTATPTTTGNTQQNLVTSFLSLSLLSVASSMVPYLVAAYRNPVDLRRLDNDLDASTTCTVARRASIAQGRALIGVWEKAFKNVEPLAGVNGHSDKGIQASNGTANAKEAMSLFASQLKTTQSSRSAQRPPPNGHLAPLFGIVCLSQSLSLADAVWIFLFNHARAVLSAAVRAGVLGPYQSQAVLASGWLREVLGDCSRRGQQTSVEDAGQCVPPMDIWGGRHELLYTRIFNS